MPHLLLEIGTEELPASFVDGALKALPDLAASKLSELRLPHGAVRALGTPRRLALLVHDLVERQADLREQVVGPPESAAYKDGKPTKAAEAFATKLGVPLSALSVVDKPAAGKQKAGRYVVGLRVEDGRLASELLPHAIVAIMAAIPFRKSMRWGTGETAFGRPIQWLVALLGPQALDVSYAGVRSGKDSRGHRFLSPAPFPLEGAERYVEQLRAHHVLVDPVERKRTMMERVAAAAKAAGGTYDADAANIEENASLVEEPHVVTGSFDRAFLELPAVVIRAVARAHQKYFIVQVDEDTLLPSYIAVANTANKPAIVVKGNDRAMRPRLSDARFFFEEDKRAKVEGRVEKLAGIVFHNKLGTVREKVARIERLATTLSGRLGLAEGARAEAKRAAHLCKFDLVSLMVGEFPELQGHMGRAYAKYAGELDSVADAVRDHYRPLGAQDAVAPADVSAVVAIADRADSLVGCFAVGLEPTGAADPYALRRACIAILRTLIDRADGSSKYGALGLNDLWLSAFDGYAGAGRPLAADGAAVAAKVTEFATERLRGLLTTATSGAVADAVLAGHQEIGGAQPGAGEYPAYAMAKARALSALMQSAQSAPWLGKAKTVAKRLSGISKEKTPVLHDAARFDRPDDATIVKVVEDCDRVTRELFDEASVRGALAAAHELAERIDAIFVGTLVNDPNDPKTPERLEVLSYGARCMLRIADFSKLG